MTRPDFTPSFQAVANANTGYCAGFTLDIPPKDWANSAQMRQILGHFAHLEGRYLFINTGPLTPERLEILLHLDRHVSHASGMRVVACLSSLPHKDLVQDLKHQNIPLAVSGLGAVADAVHLMLDTDPDYGLIDPSIVGGIAKDARRRVLLSSLISSSHMLGVELIALGVDNAQDFATCRDMICEMVAGSYVQPPIGTGTLAQPNFPHLSVKAEAQPSHSRSIDQRWISQQLDVIPPLSVETPLKVLFERMALTSEAAMIPVIERDGRPLGLLLEKTFKNLAYSAYGRDLIANRAWGKSLRDFITRCPIADASTPLDQLLATFSSTEDAPGIIITNDGAYGGFLSTSSIIRALHERTLARAKDENPLTHLPGNALIGEHLDQCLTGKAGTSLVYLDFDNFKPFNDIYGFRQGDRAILLFTQLLRQREEHLGWFVGHIGGDDFFAGLPGGNADQARHQVTDLIQGFAQDAQSFYPPEVRQLGYVTGLDRDGNKRDFPLLSASAVIVPLPPGRKTISIDDISATIAQYKKQSKASPDRIAVADPATLKTYCEV